MECWFVRKVGLIQKSSNIPYSLPIKLEIGKKTPIIPCIYVQHRITYIVHEILLDRQDLPYIKHQISYSKNAHLSVSLNCAVIFSLHRHKNI